MTEPEHMLIDYLKGSIDNLASKFDKFLEGQELTNQDVRETRAMVQDHDTRISVLETPRDKLLQSNHPILYKVLEVSLIVLLTVIVLRACPPAAKLLSGLVA